MADWRQIQARIRKAKNAPDAQVKLSDLYARTHDAMVAWELATIEEKAERNTEAVKWYTLSAERFRRPEWRKRAEEALVRLGAPVPAAQPPSGAILKLNTEENTEAFHIPATPDGSEGTEDTATAAVETDEAENDSVESETQSSGNTLTPASESDAKKKRRRGRRGGRGRRKKPAEAGIAAAKPVQGELIAAPESRPEAKPAPPSVVAFKPQERSSEMARMVEPPTGDEEEFSTPRVAEMPSRRPSIERTAQGRAGDPALASRMAQLESMLRRLVASPAHRLEEADEAPAGPGVFLLSDSDQVTSYYVESCQTLRVAVGNVARGGRGSKNPRLGRSYGEEDLKGKLAEHLGISESKVGHYMKEHCVIRWIQLDEDAAHLAHFAIGVLRTPLNVI